MRRGGAHACGELVPLCDPAAVVQSAMVLGVVTGNYSDRVRRDLNKVKVDQTSLPIAIGLWYAFLGRA